MVAYQSGMREYPPMNLHPAKNDSAWAEEPERGAAPADAAMHAPWPTWKKILAYAALAALAAVSIWVIDRRV